MSFWSCVDWMFPWQHYAFTMVAHLMTLRPGILIALTFDFRQPEPMKGPSRYSVPVDWGCAIARVAPVTSDPPLIADNPRILRPLQRAAGGARKAADQTGPVGLQGLRP